MIQWYKAWAEAGIIPVSVYLEELEKMKQGPSSSGPGNRKIEPISHNVNVAAVSQLGAHVGTRMAVTQPLESRGVQAPKPAACNVHPSGSQGKHR